MTDDSLRAQLAFIEAIDGLKSLERHNYLADGSRLENSAEHSWHAAVMAYICAAHKQVLEQKVAIRDSSEALWDVARALIDLAYERGHLK